MSPREPGAGQEVWHRTERLAEAEDTRALGERLAAHLRAGDLVLVSGELGAGKTTLAQGIGRGLGVRGRVASPTFVIARVHPAPAGRPALVHVDAYRLESVEDLETLDLDATLAESVTVVEWGAGLVERLSPDRLEITLSRPHGLPTPPVPAPDGEARPTPDGEATPSADGEATSARPETPPDAPTGPIGHGTYHVDLDIGVRIADVRAFGYRWIGEEFD